MTDFQALLSAVAGRQIAPDLAADFARTLPAYGINTPLRIAHFVGQIAEETGGFRAYVENLNYSAQGLMRTWPSHYPTLAIANAYAHRPEAIGNRSYAGRMGNGDEASGDGFKYRGRGDLETTGHDNYAEAARETGLDLINHPELLEGFGGASLVATCAFWHLHGCNELADRDAIVEITRRVNGGLINFATRKMYVARAKAELARQGAAPAPAVQPEPQPAPAPVAPVQPPALPDPAPADVVAPTPVLTPLDKNLITMARDRVSSWGGGIMTAVGAVLAWLHHLTPAEAILIVGLGVMVLLVTLYWGSRKEHHHAEEKAKALAAPAPSQVADAATIAQIAAAVLSTLNEPAAPAAQ